MSRFADRVTTNLPKGFAGWWERSGLGPALLVALTVAFGLQLLRMLLSGLVFYLQDALGASPALTGIGALAVFSLAFLAPYLRRFLDPDSVLLFTAGGVASVRLIEQFVRLPAADLVLAAAGTALFLVFLPVFLLHSDGPDHRRGGQLALGVLLGLALDTALKGMFSTLDLSRQTSAAAGAVIASLAGLQLLLLAPFYKRHHGLAHEAGIARPTLLLAFGPVLFLELLLFQNIGQQTVLTGWSQPQVFLWLAVANLVGIGAASTVMTRPGYGGPLAMAALAGLFVVLLFGERSGGLAAFVTIYGHTALAITVGLIGVALSTGAATVNPGRVFLASGLGAMVLLLLTFLYYVDYAVVTPWSNQAVFPLGVALLALTVYPSLSSRFQSFDLRQTWTPAAASVLLLVLPLVYLLAWEGPQDSGPGRYPVRVMSYNVHQGFDVDGVLDIGRLADVIGEQHPDVVALQEVSRGWVLSGSFDMPVWLSRRLNMPYVWGPAADSVWGSAVLSRYPITGAHTEPMANNSQIAMDRSYTTVQIDLADGGPLTVIASHLHHITGESTLREEQVQALLEEWSGRPRSIVLGDFNATPDSSDIRILSEAGLKDAFVSAESPDPGQPRADGYTAPSKNPSTRIDYIWVSEDLNVRDFSLSGGRASDHLAVAATIVP